MAVYSSNIDIIECLVTAGADVFQRSAQGQLPRQCAKGNYMMTKVLKLMEERQLKERYRTAYSASESTLASRTAKDLHALKATQH